MFNKYDFAHMKTAFNYAECSTAKKLKVGCIIVKDNRIISIGYNGMPSGWDNECEYLEYNYHQVTSDSKLKSKPEVLHAETNAIAKLAKSTENADGATAYITHAPCLDCAKLLYQSGIKKVIYNTCFSDSKGLTFLEKCNMKIECIGIYKLNENIT